MIWTRRVLLILILRLIAGPCVPVLASFLVGWDRKSQQTPRIVPRLLARSSSASTRTENDDTTRYPGIRMVKVQLSTGVLAQVYHCQPEDSNNEPPLVFLHGSFHAAWCWCEHWFPFFVQKGYPCIALSLRGTSGTSAGEGVKKVKIEQHARDVEAFLQQQVPALLDDTVSRPKPVLISHSFGGLAVMKYMELFPEQASTMSALIVMCSVPPSGNGPMTLRFLRRSLVDSFKITVGFAMKKCITSVTLCRDLFFGGSRNDDDCGVSDKDIVRFQQYFHRDTRATIDISDLLKHLPSKNAIDGMAPNLGKFPPCLVIGASRDFIVDREGVQETAQYFGLDQAKIVDSPHDVMLGRNWRVAAQVIHDWVASTV